MTKEQKLQEIERHIEHIIKNQDICIAEYAKEAVENYTNFFHWNAGNMYEAQMVREYFDNIKNLAKCEDIEAIIKGLDRMIRNIEHDLINSSAFGSCTNEIVNLEHRLKLDGKRAIREKLQNLYWIAVETED